MIKNFIFTYSYQLYSMVITIFFTPFLIKYLGSEAFGLIGIFISLQALFHILDGGLTGGISRECAKVHKILNSYNSFIKTYRKILFGMLCLLVIVLVIGFFISYSRFISHWLNTDMPIEILQDVVFIILLIIASRYITMPMKGIIIGMEHHNHINLIYFILNTIRTPLCVLIIYLFRLNVYEYFLYQLTFAMAEVLFFLLVSEILIKNKRDELKLIEGSISQIVDDKSKSLKQILKFSFGLWILSLLWIINTQFDKLLVASVTSLADYGFFTLALTITNVLIMLIAPINQILMPRLTKLHVGNLVVDYKKILTYGVWLYCVVFGGATLILSFFSQYIIYLWLGNLSTAQMASTFIPWLAIGNFFSGLTNFVFIFHFSQDNIWKYIRVYFLYSLLIFPFMIYSVMNYSLIGLSVFWAVQNFIFFIFYSSRVLFYNTNYFIKFFLLFISLITVIAVFISREFV